MAQRYKYLKLDAIEHGVEEARSMIGDLMSGLRRLAGEPPDDLDPDPEDTRGEPDGPTH
jgi:hypothetical protein